MRSKQHILKATLRTHSQKTFNLKSMDNTFQRYFNFYSNTWYQVFNDPIALQENSHEKQATYTKSSSHNSFTNNF